MVGLAVGLKGSAVGRGKGSNEGSGEDQAVGGGGWALRGDGGRATCGVSGDAAAPSDFVLAQTDFVVAVGTS